VFQGERPMAPDNTSLGEFTLDGLPPAPRGVPQIEITFDIDSNGILNVTAKDKASGKERSLRITGSTRLSEDEKQRMVKDAEIYAQQDRARREEAEKLNAADSTCYQAEKTLADFGAKLTDDIRGQIEAALRETREAHQKRDVSLASQRAEKLKNVLQEAGKVLYSQAGVGAEPPPTATAAEGGARPTGGGTHGRVVDAEFHETKT
jgi:molecular chaperone DnaK